MIWKKNIRKIPRRIERELSDIKSRYIVVGCVKSFKRKDISEGILSHLQIILSKNGLVYPESIIPPATQGRHSSWNINGREILRKDLPKETHYNSIEAPNWGDYWRGTHTVDLPYKKYKRDYIAPRYSTIEIECNDPSIGRTDYIIKFQVSEVLDRNNKGFKKRLFDCLNLLQENVGNCGVAKAGAKFQDYVQSLHVSWEILPPGTVDEALNRIFTRRMPSKKEKQVVEERLKFFMSLNPKSFVYGKSGFQRYFGALITAKLVVFENIRYGNAIYIMFDDWKKLSQKSRVELLSGRFGKNFERIIHKRGWKKMVRKIVRDRR